MCNCKTKCCPSSRRSRDDFFERALINNEEFFQRARLRERELFESIQFPRTNFDFFRMNSFIHSRWW